MWHLREKQEFLIENFFNRLEKGHILKKVFSLIEILFCSNRWKGTNITETVLLLKMSYINAILNFSDVLKHFCEDWPKTYMWHIIEAKNSS